MATKRILKTLELIFIASVMFIVITVTFCIVRSNNYDERFEELKVGMHIEAFEEKWGNPDNSFVYQDTLIVMKYNDGMMTDYVFKFDKRSNKLVDKWEGN